MTQAHPPTQRIQTWLHQTYQSLNLEAHLHQARTKLNDIKLNFHGVEYEAQSKHVFYGVLVVVLVLCLGVRSLRRRRRWWNNDSEGVRPGTPDLEREKGRGRGSVAVDRKPGEWIPSPFIRPRAQPYPDWSHLTTPPLLYRPFRHGPKYHITMGLRSMPWDSWIELDNQFLKYHSLKSARITSRGDKCTKTAPEAWDAAVELLEELCAYLCERYPGMYSWEQGKVGAVMKNTITQEEFDISARPLAEDPMQMCARLVQDDLAIMLERPDGQYYFLAGSILLAGFWRLEDKFGMCLNDIHTSGDVPGFREKLQKGMGNFFKRVRPEDPVLRNNYFIQVDDGLDWSRSIGGEDEERVGWGTARREDAGVVERHWFRSERQSLRRLPRSGGVVFTIRTYFHPITEICKEPYVPGRLASAIRSWGDDVSRYKGKEVYGDVLLEYLDKCHEDQVKNGLDVDREDEVRSYPW